MPVTFCQRRTNHHLHNEVPSYFDSEGWTKALLAASAIQISKKRTMMFIFWYIENDSKLNNESTGIELSLVDVVFIFNSECLLGFIKAMHESWHNQVQRWVSYQNIALYFCYFKGLLHIFDGKAFDCVEFIAMHIFQGFVNLLLLEVGLIDRAKR